MKLSVKQFYRSGNVAYVPGETLEVDAEHGAFLMRDAPGCFEEVKPRRSMRKPPKHKAIEEAQVEK